MPDQESDDSKQTVEVYGRGRESLKVFSSSHPDRAYAKGSPMESKSGLRKIATTLASVISVALVLTLTACAPTTKFGSTAEFIQGKFTAEGVEGFTAGKVDYGFTLEAIAQLAGSGQLDQVRATASAALTDEVVVGTSEAKVGYLYDSASGSLKTGLAGKYLFASKVSGIENSSLKASVLAATLAGIEADGTITGSGDNTFDYGWVTLGLVASGENATAEKVATKLTKFIRGDDGFGFDTSANTTASSADAAGMVLMAFAAVKDLGSAANQTARASVQAKVLAWLKQSEVSGNHFEAWGDVDVNSTAYAAMGLKAVGEDSSSISEWLTTQITKDGGLETPWSKGAGDTFATIQSLLALDGRSYPGLIGK